MGTKKKGDNWQPNISKLYEIYTEHNAMLHARACAHIKIKKQLQWKTHKGSIVNMSATSFIRLNLTGNNETNFVVFESCQLRVRASQSNLCEYLGFVLLF